jgi:hypothetical protein
LPIAIRGGAPTVGSNNGSTATVAVTLTGTTQPQTGDVVVFFHCNDYYTLSAMPTPTVGGTTTGVNAITGGVADAGSIEGHVKAYWWLAGSAGDQTVSVTETGNHDEEKGLVAYVLSGVDTSTPIDGSASATFDAVGSSTWALAEVAPSTADALLIAHANSGGGGAAGGSIAAPGSMTQTYNSLTGGLLMGGGVEQLSASGGTGTRTFSPASPGHFAGVMVAVKTAPAAPPAPRPVRVISQAVNRAGNY